MALGPKSEFLPEIQQKSPDQLLHLAKVMPLVLTTWDFRIRWKKLVLTLFVYNMMPLQMGAEDKDVVSTTTQVKT